VKNSKWVFLIGFAFALSAVSSAQDFPKVEVAGGYSYLHFYTNLPAVPNQNLNGGGGSFVYNIVEWLGIRADFIDYTFGSGYSTTLHNLGYTGSASANLFTYQFGAQMKRHKGKYQPYWENLYGVAHSSGYASALKAKGDGTYILISGSGASNSFAMQIGGGLDIALSKTVQIRPVELDYQLTRFGYKTYSANQNNFKYFGGINFTLGGK